MNALNHSNRAATDQNAAAPHQGEMKMPGKGDASDRQHQSPPVYKAVDAFPSRITPRRLTNSRPARHRAAAAAAAAPPVDDQQRGAAPVLRPSKDAVRQAQLYRQLAPHGDEFLSYRRS